MSNSRPLDLHEMQIIGEQMIKCICKIHKENEAATGFFLKIKSQNGHILVLMTNKHVLDEQYILEKDIIISLNNEEDYMNIDMDSSIGRRFYVDYQFDSTFIEIKENEYDENLIHFLEVDQRIYTQIESLKNEAIYILNYPENSRIVNSMGVLQDIKGNQEIFHDCVTRDGSSGSPILSIKTFQVIGIHSQGKKGEKVKINKGYLIHKPINEFLKYIGDTPYAHINETPKPKKEIINIKDSSEEKNEININEKKEKEKKSFNKMTIIYKVLPNEINIRIFGKQFVDNNRNKCKIIVEDIEQDIFEIMPIDDNMKRKGTLEIILIEKSTINDMSYLFGGDYFEGCKTLLSVPDIQQLF